MFAVRLTGTFVPFETRPTPFTPGASPAMPGAPASIVDAETVRVPESPVAFSRLTPRTPPRISVESNVAFPPDMATAPGSAPAALWMTVRWTSSLSLACPTYPSAYRGPELRWLSASEMIPPWPRNAGPDHSPDTCRC